MSSKCKFCNSAIDITGNNYDKFNNASVTLLAMAHYAQSQALRAIRLDSIRAWDGTAGPSAGHGSSAIKLIDELVSRIYDSKKISIGL